MLVLGGFLGFEGWFACFFYCRVMFWVGTFLGLKIKSHFGVQI